MFTRLNRILFLLIIITSLLCAQRNGSKTTKDYTTNLPFAMPEMVEPVFSDFRVNILDEGAIADGRTLNTDAIAKGIAACVNAGGGTVVIPAGTWMTGPIKIESNINLHLERGALVQFSNRFEDYPLIPGYDGKSKKFVLTPPIFAFRAKNIAITGDGIIDGGGEAWRPVKKEKLTARQWKELVATGGALSDDGKIWWPSEAARDGESYLKKLGETKKNPTAEDFARAREFLRPDMVRFVQCDGILLDGPTFRNSPRFHVYPNQSENIIVRNVHIQSDWYAQNGDGLDFNSCRNVLVYNTTVDVGDDAICLKPGKIGPQQTPGPACANVVIADCIVYHGHGGFVIGSESTGGVNNVSVRNCTFINTDVGLRFKSLRGKGGLVQNVFVDTIQMRNIANEAILFDMYYGEGDPESQATSKETKATDASVDALTPRFQDFSIRNIVCNGASRAILINGLPEMPVKKIQIENVNITADKGILCVDADSIHISNATITQNHGPVVTVNQSTNLLFDSISYPDQSDVLVQVLGEKTKFIRFDRTDRTKAKQPIRLETGAAKDAVLFN